MLLRFPRNSIECPGRRVRCLLVVALLVASPRVTGAGPNVWTTRGPEGGRIDALAIDPATPSTLYAGSNGGGVFKSTDGGASWGPVNTGLIATSVRALALDPGRPSVIDAGANGIFQSPDGGASWRGLAGDWSLQSVQALAVDPRRPSTIYAGTTLAGVLRLAGAWGDDGQQEVGRAARTAV